MFGNEHRELGVGEGRRRKGSAARVEGGAGAWNKTSWVGSSYVGHR